MQTGLADFRAGQLQNLAIQILICFRSISGIHAFQINRLQRFRQACDVVRRVQINVGRIQKALHRLQCTVCPRIAVQLICQFRILCLQLGNLCLKFRELRVSLIQLLSHSPAFLIELRPQALHSRRHNQGERDGQPCGCASQQIDQKSKAFLRLLHINRLNDRLISALVLDHVLRLPAPVRSLIFILYHRLTDLFHISEGGGITHINFAALVQLTLCLRLNIQKGKKLVCPQETGIDGKHLFQLDHSQIKTPLLAVDKRLIILLDGLVQIFQLAGIVLNCLNIIIRDVLLRLQIFAQNPLAESVHGFSHLKIDQSQQISRIDMKFIQLQTFSQTPDGSGQIPHIRFFQSVIIIHVGKADDFFIMSDIGPAAGAEIIFRQERPAVITVHPSVPRFPSAFCGFLSFSISTRRSVISVKPCL